MLFSLYILGNFLMMNLDGVNNLNSDSLFYSELITQNYKENLIL
jgi:hypothetical protein